MYNEPKRDLFLLLIISALLHLVVLTIFLLSKLNDSAKEAKDAALQAKEKQKKSAQVIFQHPPEEKKEPEKKMSPLLTAGAMASGPAAPTPPVPTEKPQQPILPKPQEQPPPFSDKKTIKITDAKKEREPEKPKNQFRPQPTVKKRPQATQKKKLTLADIAKGFMNYARENNHAPPSDSNHAVTVIGAQAGKATEQQLRYERYAAKLFKCIQTSLTVLLRKFRFIHKPDVQELAFNFVMDVDAKGDIAGLTVRQGTGNQQFDAFMIKVLRHASKSFPPLPAYFKTNICPFPVIYTIPMAAIQMAGHSRVS